MKKRSFSWFLPKLFQKRKDGGRESNTYGYWLIEWKPVCSIGFLRFAPDVRENYHAHAFNAWGWLLTGTLVDRRTGSERQLRPGGHGIIRRETVHKVLCLTDAALMFTVRGPWAATWAEGAPDGTVIKLGEHRVVLK